MVERSIFITGASSGLGAALAARYAARGTRLALTGRDGARLNAEAERCRQLGAEVEIAFVDVSDRTAMAALIAELDQRSALDLVIANAGVDSTGLSEAERTYRIFAVNVEGVFNTVLPSLERMQKRGRGQIAIVSSLAGFFGLPGAVDYAASKAAIRTWGEGLRRRHRTDGVSVSVVCPGFVDSRITASNQFRMPFLWPAERAAGYIARQLARDRGLIAFPWPLWLLTRIGLLLPSPLLDAVLARLPHKD